MLAAPPGRLHRLNGHPLWQLIIGVSTVLAVVVALVALFFPRTNDPAISTAGPRSSVSSTDPSTTTAPPSTRAVVPPLQNPVKIHGSLAGRCLDPGASLVTCDVTHSAEYFQSSTCTEGTLLEYAGGVEGLDTLLHSVQIVSAPSGQGLCLVHVAENRSGTLRDSLTTNAGDDLRRCLASDTNGEVSCNSSHKGEVVGMQAKSNLTSLNCEVVATQYMGEPFSRYEASLSLTTADTSTMHGCAVFARGSNVLTASLRRLGVKSLPITAQE